MTYAEFTSLSLEQKEFKTDIALKKLAQKQTRLNIILRTIRNYRTEKEIFENMIAINGGIRSYIKYFMHQDIQVSHPYKGTKVTHTKLQQVCSNTFDLIEDMSYFPKDDDMYRTLWYQTHDILESQNRMKDKYYIKYNWDLIFSHPNPRVR